MPAVTTLALDAADENAPAQVFAAPAPARVPAVAGGAKRTGAPLHELAWKDFSAVWDTDVKALISVPPGDDAPPTASARHDGDPRFRAAPGFGGSPISGQKLRGGAKRMQTLMANYAQKESDRLKA